MAQTLNIEDKLAAWLAALPGVIAVANGRVYPFMAVPQNAEWPHLTFHRVGGPRLGSLGGRTTKVSHPRVQLDAWARTYDGAKLLAQAVRLALDGLGGDGRVNMGGVTVQAAIVGDDRDDADDPLHGDEVSEFRVSMDVVIWFEEGD